MNTNTLRKLALSLLVFAALIPSLASANGADDHFAEKASAIIKPMRFSDNEKTERAIQLTAAYLRKIDAVVAQRQASLVQAGEAHEDAPEVNDQITKAWQICRDLAVPVRDAYVAQLDAIMTPAQVDRIKDGLTGDWYHIDLQRFDRMVPELTYPERAHVIGLLTEMRENAMLEIDSKLQVQWVHKYRGIINNYIAARGYDFHRLAKAYEEKYKAPTNPAKQQ